MTTHKKPVRLELNNSGSWKVLGWKLVPVEPHMGMRAAGVSKLYEASAGDIEATDMEIGEAYRAMLAAAPQPAAAPAEPVRPFGPGPFHVEQRTNSCADVCDPLGKVVVTCAWSAGAEERAQAICAMLNAAAPQPLTAEQIAALTLMLDHFSGDPRTECLRPLVYGPNVGAKLETTAHAQTLTEHDGADGRRWLST